MAKAMAMPTRKSGLICRAAFSAGSLVQKPRSIACSMGAAGWISGLPKKKARPVPKIISAMPTAMSLTPFSEQIAPWRRPNSVPARPAASTPAQGLPVRSEPP